MSVRERLPNRRACESFSFMHGAMNYVASIGRYDHGGLAEIFLTNHKVGSDAEAAARDSAVVCSIALQYGVPLPIILKALLRDSSGNPASPLGVALTLLADGEAAS
jgi:hypothetical protein